MTAVGSPISPDVLGVGGVCVIAVGSPIPPELLGRGGLWVIAVGSPIPPEVGDKVGEILAFSSLTLIIKTSANPCKKGSRLLI